MKIVANVYHNRRPVLVPRGDTPATSPPLVGGGGLLAGSAHVENGDNGSIENGC
ncbi:TPA: hypothetical protein PXM14_004102 [Yersinia enterocolitica]|nr:hypothetical protein [Yersinia enterocolitica]